MSVRIVRAPASSAFDPGARHPGFVATARKIEAATHQAQLDAEKTRARAKEDAARIVAEARAAAKEIERTAERAGVERANASALALLVKARAEEAAVVDRAREVVVGAARVVAERAIAHAISVDDATLAGWTREALGTLRAARRIDLRAPRATVERLRRSLAELPPVASTIVDLTVDDSLGVDEIIARCELGELRLSPSLQAAALVELVRAALESAIEKAPR